MATYKISNRSTGLDLGTYQGATEQEAIEAMWTDAGAAPEHRDASELVVEEAEAA